MNNTGRSSRLKELAGDQYSAIKDQLKTDATKLLKQSAKERGGFFWGRTITWMAGTGLNSVTNYFKSFSGDYAKAVREEFFNALQQQIAEHKPEERKRIHVHRGEQAEPSVEARENLVSNILNISEDDLPKIKKYELIAQMYEKDYPEFKDKPKNINFSGAKGEAYKKYSKAISFLNKNAREAVDEMAKSTLTVADITKEDALKNLQDGIYATEVVKKLIGKYDGNVEKLSKLGQNVKMLFENVAVKRQYGDGKKEMMMILTKIKDCLNENIKNENWKTAIQNAFKTVEASFLETGQNTDRFQFHLVKTVIETAAKLCKSEDDFAQLRLIISSYAMNQIISMDEKFLLDRFVTHISYRLGVAQRRSQTRPQYEYLVSVIYDMLISKLDASIDQKATLQRMQSEFEELLKNPEIQAINLTEEEEGKLRAIFTDEEKTRNL